MVRFQRRAGCHGFRDLGGFHAKPELYSRKEGGVLQNPLSPELPRVIALPGNDAGRPEAEGGQPGDALPLGRAGPSARTGTVRLQQEEHSLGINDQWLTVGLVGAATMFCQDAE